MLLRRDRGSALEGSACPEAAIRSGLTWNVSEVRFGLGHRKDSISMKAKAVPLTAVVVVCLLGSPAASASPPEVGHFSGVEAVGPEVITDLPCLEGKEFVYTATVSSRGTFVNSADFFHFTGIELFSATIVPVDGQGATYVEGGNLARINFTARAVSAGVELVQTSVNNDLFFGYLDGKLVGSATIRIHQIQHFVGLDTNGDNVPDEFKVSVTIDDLSCPG
jgi:hypothetical protein